MYVPSNLNLKLPGKKEALVLSKPMITRTHSTRPYG